MDAIRCNVYCRDPDGAWRYPWGDAVPGASDLTRATFHNLCPVDGSVVLPHHVITGDVELQHWLRRHGRPLQPTRARPDFLVSQHEWETYDDVLGIIAPELVATSMLTVEDIAAQASLSTSTVHSYRNRGYLSQPQALVGRTPLWSRPIVRWWLDNRPGGGWRSDLYGSRRRGD